MELTWFGWVYVGLQVVGSLLTIITIGKPRRVITPTDGAIMVAINALMIVLAMSIGTGTL